MRVTGSRLRPAPTPTVKLEGAGLVGYRSVFLGSIRDPILIGQIDEFLAGVHDHVGTLQPALADGTATLRFHVYGKNGTMGDWEPQPSAGHEILVLGETTAPTQQGASAVSTSARIGVLHKSYPGQKATAGNLALPLNPLDTALGPVFEFSIYHVMDCDGLELFRTVEQKVGSS